MKKYKFLLAFGLCWFASTISLFCFDFIWPSGADISILEILTKTFGMSVMIVAVLFAAQNKISK